MKRLTRRDFLKTTGAGLAGTALLGGSLAGCGGGDGGGQGGKVTLEWWDYYGDLGGTNAAINQKIKEYMKANPNVEIRRTEVGFADLKPKIIQAAATGEMPDVVIIDNPDHQSMAEQGALADLTDYISGWSGSEQYFAGPWESTMYEGKNYGVPFESNATGLYYNAEMFEEAGINEPPKTWDELREMARELTSGDRSGFLFSAVASEEGTFTFLPFLWQAGGDIPTIGDAGGVEALSFWNEMVNEDGSVSKAVTGYGQADVYNQFIAGKAAMMINGPWQLEQFEANGVKFEWSVAPWPKNVEEASILGGENYAAGNGDYVREAWDVIRWMAEPEHVKEPLLTIGLPNREDMADDRAWTKDPNKELFIDMVAIARPRAYGPKYPQISEQIWTMFQKVLTQNTAPEQAAGEAANAIKPLLP